MDNSQSAQEMQLAVDARSRSGFSDWRGSGLAPQNGLQGPNQIAYGDGRALSPEGSGVAGLKGLELSYSSEDAVLTGRKRNVHL